MAEASYVLPFKPLVLQAVGGDPVQTYTAQESRHLNSMVANKVGRFGFSDSLWVYQRLAGANFSIDVQAGQAVLAPATGANNYAPERYLVTLADRRNFDLAGNGFNVAPSGAKTHKVWLVVNDKNYAGTTYEAKIVITEDVGSGAPTPTNHAAILQLGQFTWNTGQGSITSAHITNVAERASRAQAPVAPSYASGWSGSTAVGATTGTGQGIGLAIDGNTVTMRGSVKPTSGVLSNGTIYTVATVPADYRPKFPRIGTVSGNGGLAQIIVQANGNVDITPYATVAGLNYVALDGFSYELF